MGAQLCLIDGTYELFRAYYAAPSRVSAITGELGALVFLGRSLHALAKSGEFSHFAVAFDTVIESFRNDLFAAYKTGDSIDPPLWHQFPGAERLTSALGLPVLSMREFEADDGIATLAERFREDERFERVVIASPDKDLMQCVTGDRIVAWDRLRKTRYDEAGVVTKFGIRPPSIPDYLALVGDTADGIPGVPRWGARSASTLLAEYGHLEAIPRRLDEWRVSVRGGAALLASLIEHESEVLLYRTLATLRRDVPLPHSFEDLEYRGPDAARLGALVDESGERALDPTLPRGAGD